MTLPLAAWRVAATLAAPLLPLWLGRRAARGKEIEDRLAERRGLASLPRPQGALVWIHAASVGETASVLPLIQHLLAADPGLEALLTTGTVTSSGLVESRLGKPGADGRFPGLTRLRHQFAPLDVPAWTLAFLDHWRPSLAVFVESELWPNRLAALQARSVPAALVNARMSDSSARSWARFPATARRMLGGFGLVTACSDADAALLEALGAARVKRFGNLKHASPRLPDHPDRPGFQAMLGRRPVWLAASTQPGEEAMVLDAHQALRARHPGLLTMLAPRHPERGGPIEEAARARGIGLARRSQGGVPGARIDLYVIDTIGELGLFYRLVPLAFVGGSLVPHGGQNPLEPARLGVAVAFGPHTGNFSETALALLDAGAALRLDGPEALAPWVERMLRDPEEAARLADRGLAATAHQAAVLDRTVPALLALLGTDPEPRGRDHGEVPLHARP